MEESAHTTTCDTDFSDETTERTSKPETTTPENVITTQSIEGGEYAEDISSLVVLDPNHPLMKRFQQALKEHLLRQHEETHQELNELNKSIKENDKEKEDLGVNLYNLQKELYNQKESLERIQHSYNKLVEEHKANEQYMNEKKEAHKIITDLLALEREKEQKLRHELEALSLQVVQLTSLQQESYVDSSIMKNATQKITKEKTDLLTEKLRQDMYINRMDEDLHNLQERITVCKAQVAAKKQEALSLRQHLTEANAEMQTVHFEKQQLLLNWKNSITALSQRDTSLSSMKDDVRLQQEKVYNLHADIIGYKKSIRNELERNEELTLFLKLREEDVERLQKTHDHCMARQRRLQQEYAFHDKTVHETEKNLEELNREIHISERHINELSRTVEQAYGEKRSLEDTILEKLHEKASATKVTHYTRQMIKKIRESIKQLEITMGHKENEISKQSLDIINGENQIQMLQQTLDKVNKEIMEKDEASTKNEAELAKCHLMITKKQKTVSDLNKKLCQLIESAGGVELGPIERELESMRKEISVKEELIRQAERQWLRQQGELVALTNDLSLQIKEMDTHSKKLAILGEKRIRLEAEIMQRDKEIKEVERSIGNLQNDVGRLNSLLHEEKGLQDRLERETNFLKSDFVKALKEAQLDCLQKENQVESLKNEKDRLLNQLTEAEHEAVVWEGKLRLAEENKKVLKSATHQEELQDLKSKLRKLQVYQDHLKREQEVVIVQLEQAVGKHVTLFTKMEMQAKQNMKKDTKETLKKKEYEIRRKIQQSKRDLSAYVERYQLKLKEDEQLTSTVKALQEELNLIQTSIETKEMDMDKKSREKFKNLIRLTLKQQKSKYYESIKDGKYCLLLKPESNHQEEVTKVKGQLKSLKQIAEQIQNEFPHLAVKFQKVLDCISCKDMFIN